MDLYFTKSSNYGQTWSTPTRVFSGGLSDYSDQVLPWIEVGPWDGGERIHVLHYDTRRHAGDPVQTDESNPGYYNNYYRYSDNHGSTWNSLRLTDPTWQLPFITVPWAFNDYCGMAVAMDAVVPVFTTTRFNANPGGNPECPRGNGDILCRLIIP